MRRRTLQKILGVGAIAVAAVTCLSATNVAAQPALAISGGLASSGRLGEAPIAPIGKATFTLGNRFAVEGNLLWNAADKLESERGWALGGGVDLWARSWSGLGVLAGLDYRVRDGGLWRKETLWLRAGLVYERAQHHIRGVVRRELHSTGGNRVRVAQALYRYDHPVTPRCAVRMEWEPMVVRYTQQGQRLVGFASDSYVGVVIR